MNVTYFSRKSVVIFTVSTLILFGCENQEAAHSTDTSFRCDDPCSLRITEFVGFDSPKISEALRRGKCAEIRRLIRTGRDARSPKASLLRAALHEAGICFEENERETFTSLLNAANDGAYFEAVPSAAALAARSEALGGEREAFGLLRDLALRPVLPSKEAFIETVNASNKFASIPHELIERGYRAANAIHSTDKDTVVALKHLSSLFGDDRTWNDPFAFTLVLQLVGTRAESEARFLYGRHLYEHRQLPGLAYPDHGLPWIRKAAEQGFKPARDYLRGIGEATSSLFQFQILGRIL